MQHRILGALPLGTLPFAGQAAGLAVESMTITGGSLLFNQPNLGIAGCDSNASWRCLTPGPSALIDDGIPGDDAMDADGLLGTPTNPVVSGSLIDRPIYGYFAHAGSPGYVDPDPDDLTAVVATGTGSISDICSAGHGWRELDARQPQRHPGDRGTGSGHLRLVSCRAWGGRLCCAKADKGLCLAAPCLKNLLQASSSRVLGRKKAGDVPRPDQHRNRPIRTSAQRPPSQDRCRNRCGRSAPTRPGDSGCQEARS